MGNGFRLGRGQSCVVPAGSAVNFTAGAGAVCAWVDGSFLGFLRPIKPGGRFYAPELGGVGSGQVQFSVLALIPSHYSFEKAGAGVGEGFMENALCADFARLAARLALTPSERVLAVLGELESFDAPLVVSRGTLAELALASESCATRVIAKKRAMCGLGAFPRHKRVEIGQNAGGLGLKDAGSRRYRHKDDGKDAKSALDAIGARAGGG